MTPSTLEFHVLLALGQGPSHGYAIGKDIAEQSGGRLDPTTGALYQALRRLTEERLIAPANGAGRSGSAPEVLHPHPAGPAGGARETERLSGLVRLARQRRLTSERG